MKARLKSRGRFEVEMAMQTVLAGLQRERTGKGELWMLAGLSGAGKTTFAHQIPNAVVVSIDDIRREHGWDAGSPGWVREAYKRALDEVEVALAQGYRVVFDSTALLETAREDMLLLAGKLNVPFQLVLIDTPVEVCRERTRMKYGEDMQMFQRFECLWRELLGQVESGEFLEWAKDVVIWRGDGRLPEVASHRVRAGMSTYESVRNETPR